MAILLSGTSFDMKTNGLRLVFVLLAASCTSLAQTSSPKGDASLAITKTFHMESEPGELMFNSAVLWTVSAYELENAIQIYNGKQIKPDSNQYVYFPVPIINRQQIAANLRILKDEVAAGTRAANGRLPLRFDVALDHPYTKEILAREIKKKGVDVHANDFELATNVYALFLEALIEPEKPQIIFARPQPSDALGGMAARLGAMPLNPPCVVHGTLAELEMFAQDPIVQVTVIFGAYAVKRDILSFALADYVRSQFFNQIDSDAGLQNETNVVTVSKRSDGGLNLGVIVGSKRKAENSTTVAQNIKRWVSKNHVLSSVWEYSRKVDLQHWQEGVGPNDPRRDELFKLMSDAVLAGAKTIECEIEQQGKNSWWLTSKSNPDLVNGGKIDRVDFHGTNEAKEAYKAKLKGDLSLAGVLEAKTEEEKTIDWNDKNDVQIATGVSQSPVPTAVKLYQVSASDINALVGGSITTYEATRSEAKRTIAAPRRLELRDGSVVPSSVNASSIGSPDWDKVPVGTVIASALPWELWIATSPTVAANWLPADGRPAPEGTAYSTMIRSYYASTAGDFPLIRSVPGKDERIVYLPDCRGVFLRGLNTFTLGSSSDKDPEGGNRSVGDLQGDALKNHTHPVPVSHGAGWRASNSLEPGSINLHGGVAAGRTGLDSFTTMGVATAEPDGGHGEIWGAYGRPPNMGGPETRPKNVSVYYYIKVN